MAHSPRHRLAVQINRKNFGNPFVEYPFQWGQVEAIHTSPNTVDLYLDGASTLTTGVRYLASYSPTVGDIVVVCRYGTDRWVMGKLA